MIPPIIIFGKSLWMYQILSIAGIFAAGIYTCQICKKSNHDDNEAIVFLLIIAAGGLAGSHILYALVSCREIVYLFNTVPRHSFFDFFKIILFVFSGHIFYGGLLGGILTANIYILKKPHLAYLIDIVTPAFALFHFFGRIGCFFGGCCYGIESTFGFTARYSLLAEANGVRRFPVQLLEALFIIVLFFILNDLRKKRSGNLPGKVRQAARSLSGNVRKDTGKLTEVFENSHIFNNRLLQIYLLVYSAGRFFLEFLRDDAHRGFFLGISTSQIISILIFFCTAVFFVFLSGRKRAVM